MNLLENQIRALQGRCKLYLSIIAVLVATNILFIWAWLDLRHFILSI